MAKGSILVVDDDKGYREVVSLVLEEFYKVRGAKSGDEALDLLLKHSFDLILLDVLMPGMSGLETLKRIKSRWPDAEVVMITVISDMKNIVESIKYGAHDYIVKGCSTEEILHRVNNVFEKISKNKTIKYLSEGFEGYLFGNMLIGPSSSSKHFLEDLNLAAQCDATCLITGETGAGKGAAAGYIHRQSTRSDRPFVSVNLPTLPKDLIETTLFGYEHHPTGSASTAQEGKFELADGGTIVLDEIGELGLDHQAKLLRVIEEREFERVGSARKRLLDVRIIATTSFNLEKRIEDGLFREDLYYRLKIMPIQVPALRERAEDIRALAAHFLNNFSQKYRKEITGFAPEVLDVLDGHSWRGNVRELMHLVERMVIYCHNAEIGLADIPLDLLVSSSGGESGEALVGKREVFEKQLIHRALVKSKYNKSKAARELGIPVETLRYRIKKLKIPLKPKG